MDLARRLGLFAVSVSVALALSACADDTGETDDPIEVDLDAGSSDVERGDAGGVDDASLADADGSETGEVVRRIVEREMFGEMPVDNYVLDPSFQSYRTWLAYEVEGQQTTGFLHTSRQVYPETPMNSAVLHVSASEGGADLQVIGSVLFRPEPLDISVWIGRPADSDARVEVRLSGVRDDEPSELKSARLESVASSERTIGDVRWTRHQVTVSGLFGPGYMFVRGGGDEEMYIHGAVVASQQDAPTALRLPPVELQPASRYERDLVERVREWQRRQRPDPKNQLFRPSVDPLEGLLK